MTTVNDALKAHDLLDRLGSLTALSKEQEKLLRSFLPERPKPVTLLDLCNRVHDAWLETGANQWHREGEYLDNFLLDLRDDLTQLLHEPKPAVPALPEGMRLAEHAEYGRVVVSPKPNNIGEYKIFRLDNNFVSGSGFDHAKPDELTPIDAEPAEPAEPARPEFLETVEDYESAPVGTIAAEDERRPAWKATEHWVVTNNPFDNYEMSGVRRRVLRWGWGK